MKSYRQLARQKRMKPPRQAPEDGRALPDDLRPHLTVRCPVCGSDPYVYCQGRRGGFMLDRHPERAEKARMLAKGLSYG